MAQLIGENPQFELFPFPIGLHTRGCRCTDFSYIVGMNWLTKQEQFIICLVITLLVTGLVVKYYRTAHPATTSSQPAKN